MKALSILPEYTMEIFMGEKIIEYRTWQTDYRGDLLICSSSKKQPGYVCGYAFFVVPLLDIKPDEEPAYTDSGKTVTQYDWILGKPKAIRPIPVKGKLHLYDVDDSLIQYIDGGDIGALKTEEEAAEFRAKYILQYLDPLAFHKNDGKTGVCIRMEPVFLPKWQPKTAKSKTDKDMPVSELADYLLLFDPNPPTTVEYCRKYTDMNSNLRYPSQKACTVYWLNGKEVEELPSIKAVYDGIASVFGLLWFAEALGETPNTLKAAMSAAVAAKENATSGICDAFRQFVPFERIKTLIHHPENWQIDPALTMLVEYKQKDRVPYISKGCKTDFMRILRQEGIYFDN